MNRYSTIEHLSPFLEYLSQHHNSGNEYLPSLTDISHEMGRSVSILREELEVAKAFGLVDVKPRVGIKCLPYKFSPAVSKSLAFAVTLNRNLFAQFSDLRNHVETAYWYQAVTSLTQEDIALLKRIVQIAFNKLQANPIEIPHNEHRDLHISIFSRLDNIFVQGILEAYWDIYEAVGLSVYADREYLNRVWIYHQQIVESIAQGDYFSGHQALIVHMDLISQREQNIFKIPFE